MGKKEFRKPIQGNVDGIGDDAFMLRGIDMNDLTPGYHGRKRMVLRLKTDKEGNPTNYKLSLLRITGGYQNGGN